MIKSDIQLVMLCDRRGIRYDTILYITHSLTLLELTGRFSEYGFVCSFCWILDSGLELKDREREREKACVPGEVWLHSAYGKKSVVYQPSRGKRLV